MSSFLLIRLGRPVRRAVLLLPLALLVAACTQVPAPLPQPSPTVTAPAAREALPIAATAHPLATRAALQMLERGGSVVDAAIAAQAVLGLVEPQSSGFGGGAVVLMWLGASGELQAWDGLAAAPARVPASLNVDFDGTPLPPERTRRGGRSAGVPGVLPLLATLHRAQGRLPWSQLLAPAIELAEGGFPMPPYLHGLLGGANAAGDHADWAGLFFTAEGRVHPVGTRITHPAYARTLRRIAELGPEGWLRAQGAREIAAAAQRGEVAGTITEADVLAYQPQRREALCRPFMQRSVCVMAPPSFGGVAVLQMLGMLSTGPTSWDFDDPAFVHRYLEAGHLARADRLRHLGDPARSNVPVPRLLSDAHLQERASRIGNQRMPAAGQDQTSQLVVVDAQGSVLSMTTTINLNFGARLLTEGGIALNNALSNFDTQPGGPNSLAPGARPATAMTPTIVFDRRGQPSLAGGSAGGPQIVDYVAQGLIEMMVNGRTPAQALARAHVSSAPGGVAQLERGSAAEALAEPLRQRGHRVEVVELRSGAAFVQRSAQGWVGAADPRRDGVAARRSSEVDAGAAIDGRKRIPATPERAQSR